MEEIRNMIKEMIDDVDAFRNRCSEKYFSTLKVNGIEKDDSLFDLFYDLIDGFDDVDEAMKIIERR